MTRLSRLLLGALLLTACDRSSAAPTPGPAVRQDAVVAPRATAAPSASSGWTTTPVRAQTLAKHAASLEDVRRKADKRCAPKTEPANNLEAKEQMSQTADCLVRTMNKDLDEVLLPLKGAEPARFRLLMDQQAEYNRFSQALTFVAEELMWIDFASGTRDDGTARGTAAMSCKANAATERLVYANALKAKDTAAFVKLVKAASQRGSLSKGAVHEARTQAVKRTMVAAPESDAGPFPPLPLAPQAWKELATKIASVEDGAKELARSTCEDFPGLAAALGGVPACKDATALYYLSACELDPPHHLALRSRG